MSELMMSFLSGLSFLAGVCVGIMAITAAMLLYKRVIGPKNEDYLRSLLEESRAHGEALEHMTVSQERIADAVEALEDGVTPWLEDEDDEDEDETGYDNPKDS